MNIYFHFTIYVDWTFLPLCLAEYGGRGGLNQTIIIFFSKILFDDVLVSQFLKINNDVFFGASIQDIFLLERIDISNICSHSMHACETLWSDIDGTDRKNITKINGAAPADPFSTLGTHDTCSRAPIWTFHRVSFELMVSAQPISSKHMLGESDIRP